MAKDRPETGAGLQLDERERERRIQAARILSSFVMIPVFGLYWQPVVGLSLSSSFVYSIHVCIVHECLVLAEITIVDRDVGTGSC